MARFVYDPDMDCLVPAEGRNAFDPEHDKRSDLPAPMVIGDIAEYRTIAADDANGVGRVNISSRSQHRDFLRRNGLVEVGNDYRGRAETEYLERHGASPGAGLPKRKRRPLDRKKRREDIRRAIEQVRDGNYVPGRELALQHRVDNPHLYPIKLPGE